MSQDPMPRRSAADVATPSAAEPAVPPAEDPAARRGLECRACGCRHFRVVYTRPAWGGRILRRRECRHCGRRMTTWEQAGV